MDIILLLFLTLLGILTIYLSKVKDLVIAVLITSLISLFCAVIYVFVGALDVAFTEIAVGAGVSTVLFLITLKITKSYDITGIQASTKYQNTKFTKFAYFIVLGGLAAIFFYSLIYIPPFGAPTNPAHNENYVTYIQESYNTYKVQNIITMILGSFRGYDTLGETTVVLIAAIGVYLILKSSRERKSEKSNGSKNVLAKSQEIQELSNSQNNTVSQSVSKHVIMPNSEFVRTISSDNKDHLSQSESVLTAATFCLLPLLILYGFYVQFHGDFGPGGGFQAGVILSVSYILLTIFFGYPVANVFLKINFLLFLVSLGVLLYMGVGFLTLILGGGFLDYYMLGKDVASSYHYGLFLIELGVGITVFSAMAIIIGQFYSKLKA
ncbi:putative monovalent cation/H+ antiporter subunit B [Candidatus Hepatincolaceae symbiont of Richtersius coronifer]